MDAGKIRFVEMPPPDMPGALAAKAIDAYFIGEPHAARAELDGTGPRPLSRQGHLAALHLVRAGGHREADRRAAGGRAATSCAASPRAASGRRRTASTRRRWSSPFFRQDEKLIRYVLTQPPDRVSYRMLTPEDDEMQQIADMGLAAGILERRLDVKDLVDRRFIPTDIQPARIEVSRAEEALEITLALIPSASSSGPGGRTRSRPPSPATPRW